MVPQFGKSIHHPTNGLEKNIAFRSREAGRRALTWSLLAVPNAVLRHRKKILGRKITHRMINFLAGPEQINLIRYLVRHAYEKIFNSLRSCFAFPYGHRVGGSDERHEFEAHRAAASTDRAGLLPL
jgi:hypothetical protein